MLEWLATPKRSRFDTYAFMAIGAALATQHYVLAVVAVVAGALISTILDGLLELKIARKQ